MQTGLLRRLTTLNDEHGQIQAAQNDENDEEEGVDGNDQQRTSRRNGIVKGWTCAKAQGLARREANSPRGRGDLLG
jgi:hypothetical protein